MPNSGIESFNHNALLLKVKDLSALREDWHSASLSFDVVVGDSIKIVGPNGSGKSTVLRILASLYTDFNGVLKSYIDSDAIVYISCDEYYGNVALFEQLSWYCACRLQTPDRVMQCLEQMNLSDKKRFYWGELSAGQQQRARLARLNLCPSALWLLDEPEQSLDSYGIDLLETMITDYIKMGGTVVRTCHAIASTDSVDDRQQILAIKKDSATTRAPAPIAAQSIKTGSLWHCLLSAMKRDYSILIKEQGGFWRIPLFFSVACGLAIIAGGGEWLSSSIAITLWIWALALLTVFSVGDEIGIEDWRCGNLLQMTLGTLSLWQLSLIRIVVLWSVLALPMALMAMLLAIMFGLSFKIAAVVAVTLVIGILSMSAMSVLVSAMVAPLQGRALLLNLLLLPLAVPPLLFALAAVSMAISGSNPLPAIALLTAFTLFAVMLFVPASVKAWQLSLEV